MTELTAEDRIIAIVQELATCYPRFTLSNATRGQYVKHLGHIHTDKLERVCDRLAETSTFFPSIAEILTAADPPPAEVPGPRLTGYRFVRGTHGGSYVRDETGTDHLPDWVDA